LQQSDPLVRLAERHILGKADGMSYTTESTSEAGGGSATGLLEAPVLEAHGRWEPESPFLGSQLTEAPEAPGFEGPAFEASLTAESPFTPGETLVAESESTLAGEFHQLLAELYDSEFNQALLELSEAAAEAAAESPFVQGEAASGEADRYVREWLEPVQRDAEAMLEAIGEALERHDVAQLTEQELNELFAQHEPVATGENPAFENFLGGLWRKAKAAVSGAVDLAKKGIAAVGRLIPIGPILEKLKALVRPLLERVLQMALNRLPPGLRPAAEQLARRLFGEAAQEDAPHEVTVGVPTTGEVHEVQREFDANAARLLFAADEEDREATVAEANAATAQEADPINALNAAREHFVAELQALPPGGDPRPAVENFLPAVMAVLPFVRLGISLIGRDRVVNFIAQYVAQLIRPYIGDLAPTLSQAIVSTGLKLMTLEAPPNEREVAGTVIAGTVEDTVWRLAEAGSETFEDAYLLEAAVATAFNEAAAANFPQVLVKPEYRETTVGELPVGVGPTAGAGMWVLRPQVQSYRKYTKVLRARITPNIANHVRTFGGTPLAAFLRDRYGITGDTTAPVHLYEAIPGTTLGRIARLEKRTPGLGKREWYWKLQPLTPEAAGMLLGEPGLGRAVAARFLARPERICVGERFYYLELPDRRPSGGKPRVSSQVNVLVHFPSNEIRVAVYLSEADAQQVAAALRTNNIIGALRLLSAVAGAGVNTALSTNPLGHLKWVDEVAYEDESAILSLFGNVAQHLGISAADVRKYIIQKALEWVLSALKAYLQQRAQDFIAAADKHANGMTIIVHLRQPPGMALLRALYRGDKVAGFRSLGGLFPGVPVSAVDIVPGFRNA
jgi:hypothetical protein